MTSFASDDDLAALRAAFVEHYDDEAVADYDACLGLGLLDEELRAAMAADLRAALSWPPRGPVLDAGAGSGALTELLIELGSCDVTALEPSPSMLRALRARPALSGVVVKEGFCDAITDREQFAPRSFELIISRQLTNSLGDPLTAFRNWQHWLRDDGKLAIIEGVYQRDAWRGELGALVDRLPLSANQSLALVPYLLRQVGFTIETCDWMRATNALPGKRTPRYLVVARRSGSS